MGWQVVLITEKSGGVARFRAVPLQRGCSACGPGASSERLAWLAARPAERRCGVRMRRAWAFKARKDAPMVSTAF